MRLGPSAAQNVARSLNFGHTPWAGRTERRFVAEYIYTYAFKNTSKYRESVSIF
jgi:hypothetical protein